MKIRKSGFTLVELMIAAAIIAILAAITIPLLSQNKLSAIASEGQNIMGALLNGAKSQYVRTDEWPVDVDELDDADLKMDALNTKHWDVRDNTLLGTKDNQSITLKVNAGNYSGSLALRHNKNWEGIDDFEEFSD